MRGPASCAGTIVPAMDEDDGHDPRDPPKRPCRDWEGGFRHGATTPPSDVLPARR